MSELTSIIVASFNQKEYIAQAIGSCLCQTVKEVEVIVVDDGSTDGSVELIQRLCGDSRVRLIEQPNMGPSAAVNAGMAQAKGQWLAWLGGDDLCMPDRVQRQRDFLIESQADIVFCEPEIIDAHGRTRDAKAFPVFFRTFPKAGLMSVLLQEGNFLCAPSAFMRRSAYEALGPLHWGLIHLQDYEYWLRALRQGLVLARDVRPVVKYRRHGRNLSQPQASLGSSLEFAEIVEAFLDAPEVAPALRREFGHLFLPCSQPQKSLSAMDKALFMLSSPHESIRARGAGLLMTKMKDSAFREALQSLGFSYPTLMLNSFASAEG